MITQLAIITIQYEEKQYESKQKYHLRIWARHFLAQSQSSHKQHKTFNSLKRALKSVTSCKRINELGTTQIELKSKITET